ncbi:acyl-CoA dehydrogenase [Umboniibacter marinipuniceus]|uniref:Butyryl-CoA dehydrogenase n=1 Tax=Umboniibacter marinipuniceus TaxID=569599 RepID=A0A3M0AIZ0_9GAMM|nr:acyl-CoA dehydrogenase [Umboniibacter marinipuniceus]RMA82525.1 butyryl-CoA dehydrogenase [Umboniibacter marinipuniceus]
MAPIISQRDVEFMVYEFFNCEALTQRERYAEHNRETFDATIDIARRIAEDQFLPIQMKLDMNQPTFDGERVHMIPELKVALDTVVESGLGASTADFELGGMQLPNVVASAAYAYLSAAGSTALGFIGLTNANANLISEHGTPEQIEKWVVPMREGRFAGTMAMTEPSAGSGLADLTTSAVRDEDGNYRITGNKIFISGGDHELNDNIVHLVLARIKGAPAGIKGISLFIVPKYMVNEDGSLGDKNDVNLAGLWHKMGGRGHTSTTLAFGEDGGAVGYLVGEENKGLSYMFHMMNEARILVGTGAACTALTGYQYSLDYAKERPQGRLLSNKDPLSKPVNIIQHPDVRRMLLAQKAYSEGAFALCLYGSALYDDSQTAPTEAERSRASLLLDFLTPIIKTWPSEYGPKANDLAIQVMGGHGYMNEHPVEMFYRDNRLNPIHEGTTGIQSLDLLGRKVPMNQMAGYQATLTVMRDLAAEVATTFPKESADLLAAIEELDEVTMTLLKQMGEHPIDLVFANSVEYLEMFGNVVLAWIWLRQGAISQEALATESHEDEQNFYRGKLQAMKFFFEYQLIKNATSAKLLKSLNATTFEMQEAWF